MHSPPCLLLNVSHRIEQVCLYSVGWKSYDSSYTKDSSFELSYKGDSKKYRSSPQGICSCAIKHVHRHLQWGDDGHFSGGSGSSGTQTKVSGDNTSNVSGESGSKTTSGSSKVSTVKVTGNTYIMTSGGGKWAGDANGAKKITGSSLEKTSSEKSIESKVSGTSSKITSGSDMWAGDAYGVKYAEKDSGSNKITSADKKTESKVASEMTAGGSMWAGDAYGMNKMTSEKTSKITSSKGGSVSFTVKTSNKDDVVTTSKTVVSATWQGNYWGPSKVAKSKSSKSTLKGASTLSETSGANSKGSSESSVTSNTSNEVSSKSESTSLSLKEGYSVDSFCSCKTNFEISVCGSSSSMSPPTPAPVAPLASNPSTPLDTLPPTFAVSLGASEVSCADDVAMTDAGVAVEIPVLDNDASIPVGMVTYAYFTICPFQLLIPEVLILCSGSTGSITQPIHGLSIITDSSILYVPDTNSCGMDSFTYTLTDSSGLSSCTATVTVTVTCMSGATTPPPTATSSTADEIIPHDSNFNPSPPTNMPVEIPSTPDEGGLGIPTMMPLDAPVIPDGGDIDIQNPLANDDFFTTNQDESVAIFPLLNDTFFEGTLYNAFFQ